MLVNDNAIPLLNNENAGSDLSVDVIELLGGLDQADLGPLHGLQGWPTSRKRAATRGFGAEELDPVFGVGKNICMSCECTQQCQLLMHVGMCK